MTQFGTWVSYGGAARIWLAVGLLATAGAVTCAGIWLRLPAQAARPSRTALTVTLLAWAASMIAWLAGAAIYIQQYLRAYHLTPARARLADPIAPVTILAAGVLFVLILTRRRPGDKARLPGAIIGVIAALSVFEFPFDLVVVGMVYPPVPPDPTLYTALFFVPLFATEITTLLLLRMSPMVTLTRTTFFTFGLLLAVFAVWALSGFDYPSAPVPTALNIVSKLLAFATVFTLYFYRQPPTTTIT
jgi:hypothetical protein